jgi:hypothetical protein
MKKYQQRNEQTNICRTHTRQERKKEREHPSEEA